MGRASYFCIWLLGALLIGAVFAILGNSMGTHTVTGALAGLCGALWGFAVMSHCLGRRP